MPEYLLDTCTLIRHLRRHQPTTDLMTDLAMDGRLGIATITRTEIVQGMREHEREVTVRLLNSLDNYALDAPVADLAGETIRQYRSRGITLDEPDAIIGATAIHHGLVLVTHNARHFPMPELRLYGAMPDA